MDKKRNRIIANNIKHYLKITGITQKELAEKINISPSTLSDYLNLRSNPSHGVIQKIADYFEVQKSDIDTTFKDSNKTDIYNIYSKLNKSRQKKVFNYAKQQLNEQEKSNDDLIIFEEYKNVKIQSSLSAGTGIIDLDPTHFEEELYNGCVPEHDLAFKVSGNSMEPLFEDNEIIFVEETKDVRNGQVIAVQINEEAFIKKVYIENNRLRLVSLNKKYEDIYAYEHDDIRIIGKVIL